MTVRQFKAIINKFPDDKEFTVCGSIPGYIFKAYIKEWNVYDNEVRMVTDIAPLNK